MVQGGIKPSGVLQRSKGLHLSLLLPTSIKVLGPGGERSNHLRTNFGKDTNKIWQIQGDLDAIANYLKIICQAKWQ